MDALPLDAEPGAAILAQPSAPFPVLRSLAGLAAGRVSLLVAPPDVLAETEAALILAAIPEGEVLLFSGHGMGGRGFDAYGLLARARAVGLESDVADGLIIARAFTVHQLATLLEDHLPPLVETRFPRARLILVPGLLSMFEEDEIPPAEARAILGHVLRRLGAWAKTTGLPVLGLVRPGPDVRGLRALARQHVGQLIEPLPALPRVAAGQARLNLGV